MANGDVVIVGSGIVGMVTAYYLAKAGVPSVVVERDAIGSHASGFAYGGLSCAVGSWDGRCPRMGDHVTMMGATDGAAAPLEGAKVAYAPGTWCRARRSAASTRRQRFDRSPAARAKPRTFPRGLL